LVYVVAAVAVVLVVLLVLVFVAPSLTSSSSGSAITSQTYSEAQPVAASTVSGYQGGGWSLVLAVGFDTAVTETIPVNETAIDSGKCTFNSTGSANSVTIPGTSANRSAGTSPAWEFAYRNGADAISVVDVVSGKGAVIGHLSGECTTLFGLLTVVPSDAIDSSQAAAAVEPSARAFLTANPNASAEFALIGGISFGLGSVGAEWSIVYSTCSLSPTATGTGSEFNATVNATTGGIIYSGTTGVDCASTSTTGTTYPLASSIAFDALSVQAVPPYTNYTYTATTVANGISWDNFTVQVQNTGVPVLADWNVSATSSTGSNIATYNLATGLWSAGGSQPIALGDHLFLSTTTNPTEDAVVLTGQGSFTGSIGIGL
jgi:hypothetical protein